MRLLRPGRRRQWFTLRWPAEVDTGHVLTALYSLNGSSTPRRAESLVLLAVGRNGAVAHYLGVSESRAGDVHAQLEAAVDGLAVESVNDSPALRLDRCWRTWVNSRQRPLDTDRAEGVSRGLLTALASTGHGELLAARWVLGPVQRPVAPARTPRHMFGSASADRVLELAATPADRYRAAPAATRAPWSHGTGRAAGVVDMATSPADRYRPRAAPRTEIDPEARRALTNKQGVPGWRAALHLGVIANGRRRQRQLLGRVAAAVRVAQEAGVQPGFRPAPAARLWARRLPSRRPLHVNVAELHGLAGWPIGPTEQLAVNRVRSRLLPPPPGAPPGGRVVAEATHPAAAAPLTLTAQDALHHTYLIGPTGTGKTTLILNLAAQDIAQGRSVVVIEPRGDLVADLLARIPAHRMDDVVVIDPTDPAPVGLNPLAVPGVPPELRVDHLVTVFKGLWPEFWGPRTQDILTSGLLTLTATPHTSLVALPLLFTDAAFREQAVARVHDPIALGPFWAWFNQLTPAEAASVLAPLMNKLRAFLLRGHLRRVVGQTTPRFDLRDIYRRRSIVLVNLATGAVGPESAALLGSLLVSHLWQTLLGRASTPPERRHPVMVYADEFHVYTHLPTDFADVLATARGLGVGLTLAHQHLAQLPTAVKEAVLANARSKVVFATGHDDAATLVRSDRRLKPADVTDLGRFEVYASLLANAETTPFASGRTLPPPPALAPAEQARQRSRQHWGVPAAVIDTQLETLATGATNLTTIGQPASGAHRLGTKPRPSPRTDGGTP